MENNQLLVSIVCITYNQEWFIRDCLNGFFTQKTNFQFEVLIHDDASTDNTANIIREYEAKYPNIIQPIYQTENQYSKGINPGVEYLLPIAQGKYIALCEGDDYWTDPYKLQKQVDFLEANPEYSLCFCKFQTLDQKTSKLQNDHNESLFVNGVERIEFDFERFYLGWHIGTQTAIFRKDLYNKIDTLQYRYFRDIHLYTELLLKGKGTCLNFFGAVYRKHTGGVYTGVSELQNAKIGYLCYKEIYRKNKQENFLKLKYVKFAKYYINHLKKENNYFNAILMEISVLPYQDKQDIMKFSKEIIFDILKAIKIKFKRTLQK